MSSKDLDARAVITDELRAQANAEMSLADQLKSSPAAMVEFFTSLKEGKTDDEFEQLVKLLEFDVKFIGRPKQQIPQHDDLITYYNAGRGFGKSFTGAMIVNHWARTYPGCQIGIIGEKSKDIRKPMISEILKRMPPHERKGVKHNKSDNRLEWENGSTLESFNGTEPDQLRGPSLQFLWMDELAKYRYMDEVWDNAMMCLRGEVPYNKELGDSVPYNKKVIITTTPRPKPLIKKLISDPKVEVITGSTLENTADPEFVNRMIDLYGGTRHGLQELLGGMLDDNPEAVFYRDDIERGRIKSSVEDDYTYEELIGSMDKIVVGLDPSGSGKDSTGIVVCGRRGNQGFVFEDGTTDLSIQKYHEKAIALYEKFGARKIVVEKNGVGAQSENTLKGIDADVKVENVHSRLGKSIRATPIASLYEQGRVSHVGYLDELENEMCDWNPDDKNSPDRMDAMVHAMTYLFPRKKGFSFA